MLMVLSLFCFGKNQLHKQHDLLEKLRIERKPKHAVN